MSEYKVQCKRCWKLYIKGRVIKTDFEGDELDPWGYDRDNGDGEMAFTIGQVA